MFGVIVAVVTSNAVAVLLGTEGVYESELELEVRVNYLAHVDAAGSYSLHSPTV